MSNKVLRMQVAYELAKALGDTEKAINYLEAMDSEIKSYQEIAADVAEQLG